MYDIFSQVSKKKPLAKIPDSYTACDIEVLEGLEPVRKRPGMYIGGVDSNAMHHLVSEVLDNSMDEVVAGFADTITFKLDVDKHLISISDNGRGIPVDSHPKFPDKSALEVIMTTLHSGGKFSNKVYHTAGGLHGVGVSAVNALSSYLSVSVYRQGKVYTQDYSRGVPKTDLTMSGCSSKLRGTCINFIPDHEIFGEFIVFDPTKLYELARSKAFLYAGATINWEWVGKAENNSIPRKEVISFPGGLEDYLNLSVSQELVVVPKIFSGRIKSEVSNLKLEWAVLWHREATLLKSYCNTIPTSGGGVHEQGFRIGLLRSVKDYGEATGNKRIQILTAEDVLDSSCIILSVFIAEPLFQGQTKEKLVSPKIGKVIENIVKDHFDYLLSRDKISANLLLDYFLEKAEERISRKNDKSVSRKTIIQKLRLPGKLADCAKESAEGTELFIVEGDSAGGSAKQARDRKFQAILPLRGKILNIAGASLEKIAANREIQDLETALSCGSMKYFKIENLRYEKIIIMTDADVDGAHIASLLMTFFFLRMPRLIELGHLYIARPPLYRLTQGTSTFYASNDSYRDKIMNELKSRSGKIEISRFKGLGEMTPAQLKETTMSPQNRILYRVNIANLDDTSIMVSDLMGKKAERRFEFIRSNASASVKGIINNLDV
jgi:topoisomerase-4 subunit B